jgi:hypothetical protein
MGQGIRLDLGLSILVLAKVHEGLAIQPKSPQAAGEISS